MNRYGFDMELAIRQMHLLPIGPFEPAWFEKKMSHLVPTRKGDPSLRIKSIHFHSKYDPIGESKRLLESLEIRDENVLVLFFGAGLGYVVRQFLDRYPNPCVWFEPQSDILPLAMGVNDFIFELESRRLRIITGMPDDVTLTALFKGRSNPDIEFVTHRASYLTSNEYADIQVRCETFLNRKAVNQATLSRFDRLWSRNFIRNLPFLYRSRPVQELFSLTPDARAVIVGGGPSLEYSLEDLRAIKSHALLIAVDTALMVLYRAGIDPDIVVSVDPQHLNRHYLDGYRGSALFLIDSSTTPYTLRVIQPEQTFIFQSPFRLARYFFSSLGAEIGEIAYGGSVSTNAYDLAIQMGCQEIILVGMDSGFPGGLAHVRGAILEDRLKFKENRVFRRELHNYRQMYALPVQYLPAGRKNQVATNDKLIIFYKWFERRFERDIKSGKRILNIHRGGATWPEVENRPRIPIDEIREDGWNVQQLLSSLKSLEFGVNLIPVEREKMVGFLQDLSRRMGHLASVLGEAVRMSRQLEEIAVGMPVLHSSGPNSKIEQSYTEMTRAIEQVDARLKELLNESEIAGSATQGVIFHITENFGEYLTEEEKQNPFLENARKGTILYEALLEAASEQSDLLARSARIINS